MKNSISAKPVSIVAALGFIALFTVIGVRLLTASHAAIPVSQAATLCGPQPAPLSNCRPFIGGAAGGNPGTPAEQAAGTAPGTDPTSQFNYLEQLIGRHLDIFRDYHCAYGSGQCTSGQVPLSSTDINFANRTGTYINVNWIPAPTWSIFPVTQAGNPTVYDQIVQAAQSIKAVGHPVFLSLWHEGNLHVDVGDAVCTSGPVVGQPALGTAAQFVTAWQNVHDIFAQQGVTNVDWVLNVASESGRTCLVPRMWPGDQYVDWVTWDTYSRGKDWDNSSGAFYNFLLANNGHPSVNGQPADFTNKPWGVGELGTCKQPTTGETEPDYFSSITSAVQANTYPRLHMYLVYANTSGSSGMGCLTDYYSDGTYDAAPHPKQTAVNTLFSTIVATGTTSPSPASPPPTSPPPSPSPSPSSVTGDLNGDGNVNACDLSILLSQWGQSGTTADINHIPPVNILDLSTLMSHWTGGTCIK